MSLASAGRYWAKPDGHTTNGKVASASQSVSRLFSRELEIDLQTLNEVQVFVIRNDGKCHS